MFALDVHNYIIKPMLDRDKINFVPPEMGHQYPEARCFDRTFVFDPETQARAIRFMIGFYAVAKWEQFSNPDKGKELIDSLANLTEFFVTRFPECMEEEIEIDSECGGGTYHREERLAHFVTELLDRDK